MSTLIAEDVLLLLLDERGAFVAADKMRPALAGALLAELALTGAVEIEAEQGLWRRAHVVAQDATPARTDPLLAHAIEEIDAKRRTPQALVGRLGKDLPDQLCTRLADRGILRREESRVLGLFPKTRWPAADASHEGELRAALERTLIDGEDPDERLATVIAVLAAADVLHKVVRRGSMSKRELRNRAEQVAEGGWATEAVRKAIQAAQAAVAAAVTASTAAAVSGS